MPHWLLGIGAWDPACFRRGQRYTIGVVASSEHDLYVLEPDSPLYRMPIGACGWLCFSPRQEQHQHYGQDNPYQMLVKLGYRFNNRGYQVGLHIDAYPPDYDPILKPDCEFWLTVRKPTRGDEQAG